MIEANRTRTTITANARENLQSAVKFTAAAAFGLGIGFYVGRTLSHEPTSPLQPAAAVSSAPDTGSRSEATGNRAGYLPSQILNQAKEIKPLPPTF
jgi:hypothetical protein